jgi:hypothetical protein
MTHKRVQQLLLRVFRGFALDSSEYYAERVRML